MPKLVPLHEPDSLDSARAAVLGVAYKTAWASLADGELQRGDTLLVQAGSSGTGQAAIDIGRHLGATVFATASESKHDRLRELGAEPLAYDDERVAQLGANVVFDPVGGSVFERSLSALAPGGRLVTPGAVESPIVSALGPVGGGCSGGSKRGPRRRSRSRHDRRAPRGFWQPAARRSANRAPVCG